MPIFPSPVKLTARLADQQFLNDKFLFLSFELEQPNRLAFSAGQYVSIRVDNLGTRRSYSICSNPAKNHGFDLMIDVTPMGVGVKFLSALKPGDEIEVLGPMGQFVVDDEKMLNAPLAFVVTGSGVAPAKSMITDQLREKHNSASITLFWGLRHIEDLCWEDKFVELMDVFPNFHFHPTLSQAPTEWSLCRGHVTDCCQVHELPANAHFYLCGGHSMIDDTVALLKQKNIEPDHIHFERFA